MLLEITVIIRKESGKLMTKKYPSNTQVSGLKVGLEK